MEGWAGLRDNLGPGRCSAAQALQPAPGRFSNRHPNERKFDAGAWVWAGMTVAPHGRRRDPTMLNWAVTFFVIALIAALLGFSGVAGMSAHTRLAPAGLWRLPRSR